jgi:3-deoxy-D-manno-octulosonic-acid transferase
MITFFYNILVTFLLIFLIPYFLLRSVVQKGFRNVLAQRMGFYRKPPLTSPIWVHAASVGEVFCTVPLLRRMKEEFPHREIVITTMTSSGKKTAETYLPEAKAVFLFPADHPLILRRAMKSLCPSLLLIAETELWPNLLRSCGKGGIPIILFNGRISEKSFRRYHFFQFFFQGCLKFISLFLMQTEEDRLRILKLGAETQKTKVVGNIKFDQPLSSSTLEKSSELAGSLGFQGGETLLIAGSTHPGEEEILISAFKDLRKINPQLILLLAPRHLDRLEEVEKLLKREAISWKRRTSFPSHREAKAGREMILLDTIGELMSLYRFGTIVFIGGSLVPVGGHNPLEPMFFRKPVLFGPHMFHFSEIAQQLIEAKGAIQVEGREELFLHLKRLLSDESARRELGERGFRFLEKHQGATERILEEIRPFLKDIANCKSQISN